MKHLDILVTGRVQGVFFRVSTRDQANALGVVGTVRNEPDGSVFIEAEGEPRVLEAFVDWCREGPPAAVVKRVAATEGAVRGYRDFRVTR
jgi:acylphosphatase